MAIKYVLSISGSDSDNPIKANNTKENLLRLSRVFRSLAGGHKTVAYTVDARTSAVQATGTVTFAAIAANDTVTVGNQVFTCKVSPSGANEFALGANDTAAAANLAAKIIAHTSLTGVVTATSALGVVTVTSTLPGLVGNALSLASSNGTRAAVVAMASGAETAVSMSL